MDSAAALPFAAALAAGAGDDDGRLKPEEDDADFAIGITDAPMEATAEAAAVVAFAAADLVASAIDRPAGARSGVTFADVAFFAAAVAALDLAPGFCEVVAGGALYFAVLAVAPALAAYGRARAAAAVRPCVPVEALKRRYSDPMRHPKTNATAISMAN